MRAIQILFSMIVYASNSLSIPWYYHLLASKLSLFIHLLEFILIFNEHRHSVFIIYDYFTNIMEFLTLILVVLMLLILIFIVKPKLLCESFLEVFRLHDWLILNLTRLTKKWIIIIDVQQFLLFDNRIREKFVLL